MEVLNPRAELIAAVCVVEGRNERVGLEHDRSVRAPTTSFLRRGTMVPNFFVNVVPNGIRGRMAAELAAESEETQLKC